MHALNCQSAMAAAPKVRLIVHANFQLQPQRRLAVHSKVAVPLKSQPRPVYTGTMRRRRAYACGGLAGQRGRNCAAIALGVALSGVVTRGVQHSAYYRPEENSPCTPRAVYVEGAVPCNCGSGSALRFTPNVTL